MCINIIIAVIPIHDGKCNYSSKSQGRAAD